MTTRVVTSLIGSSTVDPGSGQHLRSRSPLDCQDVVAVVTLASARTLIAAAERARVALSGWRGTTWPERGRLLIRIARAAEDNRERLAALVTRETGKPLRQARFEVGEFSSMFHYYGSAALQPTGVTIGSEYSGTQLFADRAPLGVCALITPLNYPVAVPVWGLAPALAAGNTIVWKPDVEAAAVTDAVVEILRECGLPDGVVNVVYADAAETRSGLGQALEQRLLDQVLFVGRTEHGREVGAQCGQALLSPSLQLSGVNPLVLARDGDLNGAVEAVRFSSFGVNQGCTAIRVALVPEEVEKRFVETLHSVVAAAPIGDPFEEVLYGPMFSERYAQRFEDTIGSIREAQPVTGSTGVGRISSANPRAGFVGDPEGGAYYHPMIVQGVRTEDPLFQRETLGPLVSVIGYKDFDQAIELARACSSGYLASIFTRSPATAFDFRDRVGAGVTAVNRPTSLAGETRTPMGGNGAAGNNTRLAGPWALDNFLRWQTVSWSYGAGQGSTSE